MSYLRVTLLCQLLLLGLALANAADSARAIAGPSTFNIRAFGATGDGKTLDTAAINKAIEACSKAGGGTVYFPAGTYLSGSIHLRSFINLYLDAGATILGAPQKMGA